MNLEYKFLLIKGLYFELLDTWKNKDYRVVIGEQINGQKTPIYELTMRKNTWARVNRYYLCDYYVDIYDNDKLKHTIWFKEHLKGKKVFISFDSSALGDNIAWMPYCREFKKKYECEVIVSTFKNFLFEKVYTELKFVGRGVTVNNITAMLELGWFWNKEKEPVHPATIPLQKAASNILGLDYQEIVPDIDFTPKERPIEGKYVVISTHSTSGLKYWTKEGWQTVINWLNREGYKVFEISKEESDFENVLQFHDKSIENTMNHIHHSEFFIGLSSGLAWLSWGMGKRVVMIANFTSYDHEFTSNCVRITDGNLCNSCWNNPMFKFDKGNWNYCPEHEDTPRQFECHRLIKPETVIERIKNELL